jgi:type I restriction enzyme S subunit
MINEDWPKRTIGDLFEIGAGKSMSAVARDGNDKTPFLRTSNVLWDEIDLSTVDEMSIPARELQAKLLLPGDLLVCEGGEIGRAAVWDGELETMSFQNHLHRLRPLTSDIEPRFYAYFLQCAFTQLGIFEGAGNKTTIPNLSRNGLAALEAPHPSLDEQRSIVSVLGRIRRAIKVQVRSAGLGNDLRDVVMRTLFTRGLRGERQKETELGPAPETWETATISSLFEIVQGLSLKGNLSGDGVGFPFLRTSNVYWGRLDLSSVSRMHVSSAAVGERTLRRGDLLVCEGGEIGRAAVWSGEIEPCTFQNHLYRLRPRVEKAIDPRFAALWLEEGFLHRRVYEGAGNQTTIPNLSRTGLGDLRTPVPSWDEQQEILAILDAIDRKIDVHRRKRGTLDELFRALLQKLMTGEIRVGELDLSALEPERAAELAV